MHALEPNQLQVTPDVAELAASVRRQLGAGAIFSLEEVRTRGAQACRASRISHVVVIGGIPRASDSDAVFLTRRVRVGTALPRPNGCVAELVRLERHSRDSHIPPGSMRTPAGLVPGLVEASVFDLCTRRTLGVKDLAQAWFLGFLPLEYARWIVMHTGNPLPDPYPLTAA